MRTLFFLLFLALAAYGQTLTSVAVLPSDGTALNNDELEALTDKMRLSALKVLPPETFVLLKQDVVVKRLGGMEKYIKECTESSCIVDLGIKANVDYVSQASVGKLGNKIRLKVELYNVRTGGLVGMLSDEDSENIKDLLAIVENKVPAEVFGKIPGISGSPKAAPPPPTPQWHIAVPQQEIAPPTPPSRVAPPPPVVAPVAVQKQCEKVYNINEVVFKMENGLLNKLSECSSKQESKSFLVTPYMTQCAADYIKKELPAGFPNTNKILEFGSLAKLINVIGSDYENDESSHKAIKFFLSEVKNLADGECIVDEPYEPPSSRLQFFGPRIGLGDGGLVLGVVRDIAITKWLYIQPGLMYTQKRDYDAMHKHPKYLEIPLLLSLKFSAFNSNRFALRLNAGTYFGLCIDDDGSDVGNFDIGLHLGAGFDIGMFYIGVFIEENLYGHGGYAGTASVLVGVNL